MNCSIEFHPLAELFPMMGPDELAPIIEDMQEHGFDKSKPVVTLDGKILDGRNRYAAAIAAGVEATFEPFHALKHGDPLEYVVRTNLHRRHLSSSQRAMVAAKIASLPHGGDRTSEQGANLHLAPTIEEASQSVGVSPRQTKTARKVISDGDKEIVKAVEAGEIAVSDAAAIVDQPKPVQAKAAEKVRKGEAKTAREAVVQVQAESDEVPDETLCDKFGTVWPAKSACAVAELGTIKGLFGKLSAMEAEFRRLSQIAPLKQLGAWDIATHLKRIRDTLTCNQPYAVCPRCAGGDTGASRCVTCDSHGWATKEGFNRVPKDDRKTVA